MGITRRTKAEAVFDSANIALLVLFGLLTLYPFLYTLTISVSTPRTAMQFGLHFFPTEVTLDSYKQVIEHPLIYRAYINTVVRTLLGTGIMLFFTVTMAYPLSRRSFPHRKALIGILVFSMLFNGGMVPTYLLVKQLGMINTLWALIIPSAVSAFYIIVMRNYILAIHEDLLESARIDGAGEWRILWGIILPLSLPVLAVIALWSAVGHWNSWFDAVLYINEPQQDVLQSFLRRTILEQSNFLLREMDKDPALYNPATLMSAMLVFVSLPIILTYPFLQKYFAKGIMLGSVKS